MKRRKAERDGVVQRRSAKKARAARGRKDKTRSRSKSQQSQSTSFQLAGVSRPSRGLSTKKDLIYSATVDFESRFFFTLIAGVVALSTEPAVVS